MNPRTNTIAPCISANASRVNPTFGQALLLACAMVLCAPALAAPKAAPLPPDSVYQLPLTLTDCGLFDLAIDPCTSSRLKFSPKATRMSMSLSRERSPRASEPNTPARVAP